LKKHILSGILTIIILSSEAQSTKTSFRPYYLKKNQHTITYSPTFYIGYKWAYCFNPRLGIGCGISLGVRSSEIPTHIFEMAKLNVFYRIYIINSLYVNMGAFYAIEGEIQPYRGFVGEIFCGWNHFKLGQGIQLGSFDDQMSDQGGEEFIYSMNFLILQLNF